MAVYAYAGDEKVVSPIVEIPAGRFAYCLDPDGNSIGLFTS
jgi:predicted enzyme related to lactoylglutathione lyase